MKRSAVAARPVSRRNVVACSARQSWLPGSQTPKHLDSPAALAMAGNFGEPAQRWMLWKEMQRHILWRTEALSMDAVEIASCRLRPSGLGQGR